MPRTIRIGKSQENNFVINNPTVSRNHAELVVADDNCHAVLRDLGSKNGTFVNGVRIDKDKPKEIDRTSQLRFGSENTSLSAIISGTKVIVPHLSNNGKVIGRNADCQIRMNYDDVSKRHAILTKRADGTIYIEDLNSSNGTFVNGERITSRILNKGDRVTITRNHELNWESIYSPTPAIPSSKSKSKRIVPIAAAIIVVIFIGIYIWNNRSWSKERIYSEYNSAVCWVYTQYGYKVFVDGEDFTSTLCRLCDIEDNEFIYLADEELKSGCLEAQGTAFFITDDGKLATNLHIARPWLYSNDINNIENGVNRIIALLATEYPLLNRSHVQVEGVMVGMYIIPNGLPISSGNLVRCSEVKCSDDTNKDVAIIQTETRDLTSRVEKIIDIKDADTSEKSITVGKTIFTIGFPYGASIAINNNQELRNQVHSGSITQNRGEIEFGHDAETASGASGSPIFNDKGKLVGIHHAGMTGVTGAQGFNMGIKAKYIQDLLQ